MKWFCAKKLCVFLLVTVAVLWLFQVDRYSWAQESRPTAEGLAFDPKKTDDLLEKIDEMNKSYAYYKGSRRDPFGPLIKARDILEQELLMDKGTWELFCDRNYDARAPLASFPIHVLKLKGVVWGSLGKTALIKDPDGKAHNVKTGDFVGTKCGKVIKITNKYLKIEERYKDKAGRVRVEYKYKLAKRKVGPGLEGKLGEEGELAKLEEGSPTDTITLEIDAEENTLVTRKNELKKLKAGNEKILSRVKTVTIGPGDFEAVIVGGAFNIDLPKTTRFRSQVTVYIPKRKTQSERTITLGLDNEFISLGLSEIANLGKTVRFTLKEEVPVYFFFKDINMDNTGVVSVTVSRLLTAEEVQAAKKTTREKAKKIVRKPKEGERK